jgi:hypothetical protein
MSGAGGMIAWREGRRAMGLVLPAARELLNRCWRSREVLVLWFLNYRERARTRLP